MATYIVTIREVRSVICDVDYEVEADNSQEAKEIAEGGSGKNLCDIPLEHTFATEDVIGTISIKEV